MSAALTILLTHATLCALAALIHVTTPRDTWTATHEMEKIND